MALTFSNSPAVIAAVLLNLSLCLLFLFLFLFLKTHKKKQQKETEEEEEEEEEEEKAHSNAPEEKAKEKEKEEEKDTEEEGPPKGEEKKRKKRARKKKQEGASSEDLKEKALVDSNDGTGGRGTKKPFPFSSFESAMQRRIQVKYDELVTSNQANRLTSAQVSEFIDCLIEARNELQHKSELIQRSFRIKKALLSKADRSSFDRLYNQVFKLEYEHKRLQQDAAVYNVLQEQLKLSPAYKTMLEISDKMKSEENKEQNLEFSDISFEELLAQEKKDSFWQKNGKMRSFAN